MTKRELYDNYTRYCSLFRDLGLSDWERDDRMELTCVAGEGSMTMNKLKEEIQSFFDKKTVTIVGSGLSCAEQMPGMTELAQHLIDNVDPGTQDEDINCWEKIKEALVAGKDLESALKENRPTAKIEKSIVERTYKLISGKDEEIFKRVVEDNRVLQFSKYLSKFRIDTYDLVVVTTNYDLLIEYACESGGVDYIDSFCGNVLSRYCAESEKAKQGVLCVSTEGRKQKRWTPKKHVKLYKPHGSINWKRIRGSLFRINHVDYGEACIITPGPSKYKNGYEQPYEYHIKRMGEEIDKAMRLVFIGYGFNDDHLETHIWSDENKGKRKLIVTKALSDQAKDVVDKLPNTIAMEEWGPNGTKVYVGGEQYVISDVNLWEIGKLVEEVL